VVTSYFESSTSRSCSE